MQAFHFKKLTSWIERNLLDTILVTFILGIAVFVAYRNYVPSTWLLGWDNLVPELNFKLNIARSLSAVWQEYQGLGLLGGMAHAADLPRQLILLGASVFMPVSLLRYFWTFAMLAAGPLGVYFLVSKALAGPVGSSSRDSLCFRHPLNNLAGFVASMFYLFNLATVQTLFTPFETFVSFYGFFPWLLYLAQNYLRKGGKKKLLVFAIVSFLATPAFYVQTLFIVYTVFLAFFALETIVRSGGSGLTHSIKLAIVTFFINAFWLFPVIYFALASPGTPGSSHINSIATPETQIMNQARSGFINIATLKGYWFDYFDWNQAGSYDYLYREWLSYSSNLLVVGVSLILFFASVVGLVLGIFKKEGFKYSFLLLLLICYYFLAGGQVPVSFFAEAFRNAFTKWSIPFVLVLSVGIGSFIRFLGEMYWRRLAVFLSILASVFVALASVYTVYPVFNGKLIAESMRINLPGNYLDTVNYFKSVDSTKRIVSFPLTDFWGWQYNDWGYRGSGFLWYGIPQPILSRTFDVWNPKNEGFYTEISHSVEMGNSIELKYILGKYQVEYILFDGSIFEPGNVDSSTKLQREKDLLEASDYISKVKEFGKVAIYQVNLDNTKSFVSAPTGDFTSAYTSVGPKGDTPVVKEAFSDSQGYEVAKNCDLKNQGSVDKKKLDGGNYYAAFGGGISCDYFYYPTLDASKAYVMRIQGKNISGRSLKFYLYNIGKNNVDREELLPTGEFDKSYVVLPTESSGTPVLGYTLNVETRSFGKIKSENLVTAIEFYPVSAQSVGGPVPIENNLMVTKVQKYGTWAYKVDVQGGGLIQLGQGYEAGWVAFELPKFEEFEHQKFNGWSNAWVIPSAPSTQRSVIYIVYWPQLLECGGMILGIITFVLITRGPVGSFVSRPSSSD